MRQPLLAMLGSVAALVVMVLALEHWLSNLGRIAVVLGVIQSIATIVAIFLGGVWAYFKLQIFRDFEPHLTIVQAVSHRPISDGYLHLSVIATLHNSSKVKIEVREAAFRLQRIGPLADPEVEQLYAQVFIDNEESSIQWTSYDELERSWGKGELIIEPGESHHEAYEFIVSREIDSVVVYAYFHNPEYREGTRKAQGWSVTTVHDMVQS